MDPIQDYLDNLEHALWTAKEKKAVNGDARYDGTIRRFDVEIARVRQFARAGPKAALALIKRTLAKSKLHGEYDPEPVGTVPDEEYAPDNTLNQVMRRAPWRVDGKVVKGLPTTADPDAEATLALPILPLLRGPEEPPGLSGAALLKWKKTARSSIVWRWAEISAQRWAKQQRGGKKDLIALEQLAREWECSVWECRVRLVYRGALEFLNPGDPKTSGRAPQYMRIGKDEAGYVRDASGKRTKIVPMDQHLLALMGLLPQKLIYNAKVLLAEELANRGLIGTRQEEKDRRKAEKQHQATGLRIGVTDSLTDDETGRDLEHDVPSGRNPLEAAALVRELITKLKQAAKEAKLTTKQRRIVRLIAQRLRQTMTDETLIPDFTLIRRWVCEQIATSDEPKALKSANNEISQTLKVLRDLGILRSDPENPHSTNEGP